MALDRIGAMTLFVGDLARTKEFYERVFALPVVFEDEQSVMYGFGETYLNLLVISAADELVTPAHVATAGARFMLTAFVDDVDAEVARLGLPLLNGPQDRPWGVRTAAFVDPDGHVWELAQDLPAPDSAQP